MRFDDLQYLLEVSKHRSMNKASSSLFISPQALGLALRRLENELGFKVIHRSRSGVSLTEEGRLVLALYKQFKDGVARIQEKHLESNKESEPSLPSSVHFIVSFGFAQTTMAKIQSFLYRLSPDIAIDVTELSTKDVLDYQPETPYYIKIVSLPYIDDVPIGKNNLTITDIIPLTRVDYHCYINKRDPLAQNRRISLREFFEKTVGRFTLDASLIDAALEYLSLSETEVRFLPCSSVAALSNFVSEGLCVGLNPHIHGIYDFDSPNTKSIPFIEHFYVVFGILLEAHPNGELLNLISLLKDGFAEL